MIVNGGDTGHDRALLLPLVGAQVIIGTSLFLLPVLVDTLRIRAGMTARAAGLLLCTELGAAAVTTICLSGWSRRHAAKPLAMTGAALTIAGTLFALISPAPAILVGSRLAAGIGAGMVGAGAICFLARVIDKERMIALVTISSIVNAALWLAVLPYMIDRLGYRAPYLCLLLVDLVGALLLLRLPGMRTNLQETGQVSTSPNALLSLLVVAAVFLTQLGQGAFWSTEETYGKAAGFNDHGIGIILSISTLILLLGALGSGWAGDRYGRFTTLFALLSANAIAIFLVGTVPVRWVYLTANIVQAITNLSSVIYQLSLSARMDRLGRTVAMSTALVTLGNGIGPGISATLGAASVSAVVLVLNGAALALYCIVMMRFVDESQMTPSLT